VEEDEHESIDPLAKDLGSAQEPLPDEDVRQEEEDKEEKKRHRRS
jgi:hypothetical protein